MNKLGHGAPSSRSNSNNQNRNRRQHQQQHRAADSSDAAHERRTIAVQAHTRSPVLTREPTVLESFSRNLRTFFPNSISSTSPPKRRRRPLSFGGVIGSRANATPALTPSDDEAQRVLGSGDDEGERIIWAAWDELEGTRVLILAYTTGLQIWDAGNLSTVRELLNLKAESLQNTGPVLCAVVLPTPVEGPDEFESARPLLGVLTSKHLVICSLVTHVVIKQIPYTGATTIVARPAFIVISTTHPHMLHILSSRTLLPLHTITLATPPVFALSLRLLAYVSQAPTSHNHGPPAPTFISRARDSLSASVMRVGGEVWSGVKAAVATSAGMTADDGERTWGYSRSAPAASRLREQWLNDGQAPDDAHEALHTMPTSSGWVTVLDLKPLLHSVPSNPRQVAYFAPFPPEPAGIAHLTFVGVGATPMLCAAPRDGQRVAVFQIRPGPARRDDSANSNPRERGATDDSAVAEMPWHWYDLRRGVTSARVENVVWDRSGKWAGIATGRRTVHVFATNPYGGKPDERSHLQPQVYNALELQPLSTEISPLVRLRPSSDSSPPDSVSDAASLVFTFLPSSASLALPPSLLPQATSSTTSNSPPTRSAHSSPVSLSPVPMSGPRSNHAPFQDVLLFDPATGVLSLRRLTLDWVTPPLDSGAGTTYSVSVPGAAGYSMSLPVPIGMGRKRPDFGERHGELTSKESVVATWALKRGREWAEVKNAMPVVVRAKAADTSDAPGKVSPADYLAQAELSTHSRSPAVLPRPIYLSHQFSFHALGEDYHALLRRSQLALPSTKIEVRKDVEVSAYAGDAESGAFVQGAVDMQVDPPLKGRDRRAGHGSFDEPIASAIRTGLDYSGQSPPVLPMLPNGASLSMLDTIPIHTRHVAAGVNEGLGRIRREIGKVRSPILRPTRPEGRHVPLEFDEEDEAAFLEGEAATDQDDHEGASHDDGSGSGASASVSTPSTRSRAGLDAGGDDDSMWDAWDDEARATVAEAEAFDEISATGLMDEEHAPIMAAMSRQQGKGGNRR